MASWFCSPDKTPRIETFAEENSSKAIKRPNMGNIVIYGLCGEKRRAKGHRIRLCSVERWLQLRAISKKSEI